MTVDFHGRPSSLNRFMEGKGRTRDGFDDEASKLADACKETILFFYTQMFSAR